MHQRSLESDLRSWLEALRAGELGVDDVLSKLATTGDLDVGVARLDVGRRLRTGVPEAVLAEGKSDDELVKIVDALRARGEPFLVTRLEASRAESLLYGRPELAYERRARLIRGVQLPSCKARAQPPWIVTAGTSDLGVADEAYWTMRTSGLEPERICDVGVAGLHRLVAHLPELRRASVIVVVAGMEGALASVLAGLVACPVVAVPTSVGYGASFSGIAALLGMLNACAPGVTVSNIDNGFGAAAAVIKMLRQDAEIDAVGGGS